MVAVLRYQERHFMRKYCDDCECYAHWDRCLKAECSVLDWRRP
jgi:hypothetical protein